MSNNVVKFLPPENQETVTDIEYARKNLYDLIENGMESVVEFKQIASQSQHPRSFEVLANMIKTMAEINEQLINVSKEKKQAKEAGPKEETPGKITNNLFVGSTAELAQMLKGINKE